MQNARTSRGTLDHVSECGQPEFVVSDVANGETVGRPQ